jgi:glycosyltransferase involved in cell wall biosynthesis
MEISVVIPTRGRADRLGRCLRNLARQSLPANEFQVLVGFDGADDVGPALAQQAWLEAGGSRSHLIVLVCPRAGLAAVRNALLPFALGKLLLSTNDDLLAEPQLLSEHVRAHQEHCSLAVVTGDSPWVVRSQQSVFDVMLEETSMVFFYHRMRAEAASKDAKYDWGFRHAWGLNMSCPTESVRRVGGFTQYPSWYGYEDNEIAFKLKERYGVCPVLFAPRALGWHDHAMTPREYLSREYKLGFAALGFTRTSPACSHAMFRRDLLSSEEEQKVLTIATENEKQAKALMPWFASLASMPSSSLPSTPEARRESLQAFYEKHLLLKRWMWNIGLRDALAESANASVKETGEVVMKESLLGEGLWAKVG